MTIKIKANQILTAYDGKPFDPELVLGKVIATILSNTKGDSYKLMLLGERFYTEKSVDIDDSDYELINKAITDFPVEMYNNLVKGKCQRLLKEAKESSKEVAKENTEEVIAKLTKKPKK